MKYARFEDLPVWKAAARFFVSVDTLCDDLPLRSRGHLADQLHRAALWVSNNIAEGYELGTTAQLIAFLYVAKGSAGECRSMCQTILALPRLAHLRPTVAALRADAESISRQLAGFAHSLQNSEMKGAKFVNDSVREQTARKKRIEAVLEETRRHIKPLPEPPLDPP